MSRQLNWRATAFALAAAAALTACGGNEGDADNSKANDAAAPERHRETAQAVAAPAQATWSAPIALTLVPTAAANLPNGKLIMWSAQDRFSFNSQPGSTYSTLFDPATNTSAERLVSETNHNMFCPGTTNLGDGRVLVSGGSSSGATSLYDPVAGTWSADAAMNIPRAYEANTLLADGSVLTLGGSWNGGQGNKHAEVWTAGAGWRRLTGVPVDPMVGPDPAGVYRGDNHMWLIATGFGRVLHAGPNAAMNWIDTRGNGATTPAGLRGDDPYAINGSTVMYDIGKILKTGGAQAYQDVDATNSAHLIDVNGGTASVRRLASMNYARAFHNSVVLPNGQVLLIGGQTRPVPFSDNTAILVPELWDPATETFTMLPPMQVPRVYHSTALLLPDARVASIGGGLCGSGCAANHADLQIITPAYLLNSDGSAAARPAITSVAAEAAYGTTLAASTDKAVASFALVRLSSTTHTVNNDQRRIPLQFTTTGDRQYALAIPSNPGIALPGYYMLFAMTAEGVPSVAKTLRLVGDKTPQLTPPGDQISVAGVAAAVNLLASGPGTISYAASGLPAGLGMNAASGAIAGVPSTPGTYRVTVSASNAAGIVSTNLLWTVQPAGTPSTRYVKLEALSEVAGRAWTTVAEFNLLDPNGQLLPRTGWTASADSQETQGENAPATNAIDGLSTTFWHTQWQAASPPPPHSLIVDLGSGQSIAGFRMLPRQDINNGRIANWRFHVSADGVNWRVVAQGTFADDAIEKTVFPIDTSAANRSPVLQTPVNPTTTSGDAASLALLASDPDGDVLSYAASGLPPGLAVNATSGAITGVPTTPGVYNATAVVGDGRGGTASASFSWTVLARSIVIQPVAASPIATGGTANYTASANAGSGARYVWDFGDGSAPTASSPQSTATHAYAAAGLYTVTLTVTDAAGNVKALSFTQAVYAPPAATRGSNSSNVVLQKRSGANAIVWIANQDADSVSAFDASTLAKLGEVSVGSAPRSVAVAPDGRVWVTNKYSASISVINPATLAVAQTIALPRASQPFGLAFSPDGRAAYVALEATGNLIKLDPSSGALLGTLSVGPNPRQVAVMPDSSRVLVSRFISPPLPGEGTATVQTEVAGVKKGGEVVIVTSALAIERTIVLKHSDKPDSTTQGRGVPNYLAAAVIAPDGKSAWVPSKQDNIKRGSLRDGNNLDFQNTVRAISSRIDLASFTEDEAARVDHDNAGLASAAAFHPTGAYLFVALQTSRQIAVIDPVRKAEVLRFDAGRAPDGLAVSDDGLKLFVNNFMDRTLQVFDLSALVNFGQLAAPSATTLAAQRAEKLSPAVLLGKQLFYDARDPRLARDAYMSCASCHNDGGHDGRTWDLTGLGEGLRNTIALRGRAGGQGFKHWSANFDEIQDFEGQIRSLAQGTGLMSNADFNTGTRSQPLGRAKAGVSADLDALAAYVSSLDSFAPSPLRNADGSFTTAAVAGKAVFAAKCASCHSGAGFTDSSSAPLHDVGTLKASSGKRLGSTLTGIDTPTLRDAWATAPYLHDGSAASLSQAISAHTNLTLAAADLANVSAYVSQIGGEEPGPRVARYVRLQALSEVNGKAWTSMAEFNLLDAAGNVAPRSGWAVSVDSQETQRENGAGTNAIDGKTGSFWHTQWSSANPPPPHTFTVDMGQPQSIGGFKYLPRTDGIQNGRIASWRFYTSTDGSNWTQVTTGSFANTAAEKTTVIAP